MRVPAQLGTQPRVRVSRPDPTPSERRAAVERERRHQHPPVPDRHQLRHPRRGLRLQQLRPDPAGAPPARTPHGWSVAPRPAPHDPAPPAPPHSDAAPPRALAGFGCPGSSPPPQVSHCPALDQTLSCSYHPSSDVANADSAFASAARTAASAVAPVAPNESDPTRRSLTRHCACHHSADPISRVTLVISHPRLSIALNTPAIARLSPEESES